MTNANNDLIDTFLLVYAGLFPIVNPLGNAPIFLGLTHARGARYQCVSATVGLYPALYRHRNTLERL